MRAVLFSLLLLLAACSTSKGATGTTTTAPTSTAAPTTTSLSSGPTATATPITAPAGPCLGTIAPPRWDHVVWILMENRGLDQVEGNPQAPYINHLGAQCGLATNYSGVAHPSLPNYIALTSGSTHGITDDADPADHPVPGPSLFSLLGAGWRSLEESMPSICDHASGGEYAAKHNPAAYYTAITASCPSQDVPLRNPPDLSARFTFVTPNVCDDMHDCSTSAGDTWLSHEVPMILNSSEYRSGRTALFITWDENDSGGSQVPFYVIAPSVTPGTRTAQAFNHYSLLRTTEEMLGLTPLLGGAASATSMRSALRI